MVRAQRARTEGNNYIVVAVDEASELARWLQEPRSTRARPRNAPTGVDSRLRFAFYGRVSTADHQDPAASYQWQREVASQTVSRAGAIVGDFFDVGCSRELPWNDRPQASALLAVLADPDRGFDAVVVGESDRAFSGTQLQQLLPTLRRHRVALWLPELGGPLNPSNPTHQALVMLLGHDARREVLRARHRTLTAMRVLARDEGRYLGGRPPYGYRLVDAGPHPNPAHARWGRRLQRLDPDPATAGHVPWIFAQRLAHNSAATIADMLNRHEIICPSGADPGRNPHRSGRAWTTRAVDGILANPRYTGRQVWDRQRTHHQQSPGGAGDQTATRRASATGQWVISGALAHPPLIDEATFIAAQRISSLPEPADGKQRSYLLTGLVICAVCERRAESYWAHGRPGYRCRHGHRKARPADSPLPFYAREEVLVNTVADELGAITGRDRPLWDAVAVAGFLRAHGLTLRCSRDRTVLVGDLPGKAPPAIPGIFGNSGGDGAGVIENVRGFSPGNRSAGQQRYARDTKRKPRRLTARLIPTRNQSNV